MTYYTTLVEVWVKPLFKKARPKNETSAWAARDFGELYELIREHYKGKRYRLLDCAEIATRQKEFGLTPAVGNIGDTLKLPPPEKRKEI